MVYEDMIWNGFSDRGMDERRDLLAHFDAPIDAHCVAELWNHGSVIRSWLLELTAQALAKGEPVPDNEGSVYAPARGGYFLAPENMKLTEAYEHATREAAKKRRT